MNKKHHFLLFRHCVRSVDRARQIADHIGVPMPEWGVPADECTVLGNDMVGATGRWLINSGTIVPDGAKIKWEIIADDYHRDVDTAYFLAVGIQEALDKKYGGKVESVGLQEVHIALLMVEQIMGRGRHRPLDIHPIKPEYNPDTLEMIGAALFLSKLGDILLFSRLSDINPPFAPNATVEQVFQLAAFHSWYRTIEYVGNSDVAIEGGIRVQALFRVLRKGYFLPSKSSLREEDEEEDYDTHVTIILGHDDDLEPTATALGATWNLKEPFISGPEGAFLTVPPMSGIHAVRDVTTEQVDLAFLYPDYVSPFATYFYLNKGGSLLSVPLLFAQELPFSQVGETSTSIQPLPRHQGHDKKTGVDILEEHTLQVLAGYHETATRCYHQAVDYWAPLDPQGTNASTTIYQFPSPVESYRHGFPAFLLFIMGILVGMFVLALRNRWHDKGQQWTNQKYKSVQQEVSEFEDHTDDTSKSDTDKSCEILLRRKPH